MLKSMGVLLLASGEAGSDLNRKEKRKREKDEEKRRMRWRVLKWLALQLPGWRYFKRGVWKAENWGPFSFGFSSKFSFEFSVCEHWNWGKTSNSHCWKCRFLNFPFSWKYFCLSSGTEGLSYWVLDESLLSFNLKAKLYNRLRLSYTNSWISQVLYKNRGNQTK